MQLVRPMLTITTETCIVSPGTGHSMNRWRASMALPQCIALSRGGMPIDGQVRAVRDNGAQGRDRTTDTAIFSRMLYQLSYLGISGRQTVPERAVYREVGQPCPPIR